ncbi:hypothetical protein ZHAS_00007412 [Anopheles sinensis]|uniref:Uncharacterized protein n=1 Tax=Anopheles sinensis TaxID=74873 RepID=A0A084VP27_ANOSI|nr:hypothetical protein ZHAS_00007412 [Anopheles sinensis]
MNSIPKRPDAVDEDDEPHTKPSEAVGCTPFSWGGSGKRPPSPAWASYASYPSPGSGGAGGGSSLVENSAAAVYRNSNPAGRHPLTCVEKRPPANFPAHLSANPHGFPCPGRAAGSRRTGDDPIWRWWCISVARAQRPHTTKTDERLGCRDKNPVLMVERSVSRVWEGINNL